jgi:DTW domain-containing protein
MQTRTRIVLLMHHMEYRRQKCTTGRITCLHLANSEIIPGVAFDDVPRVRELIDDPRNYPVLLYPGGNALRLEDADLKASDLGGRQLVVFLIDGTWACARKSFRESPRLLGLPRLALSPRSRSRFVIKRQPHEWCLSTLEATHELLLALEAAGLDSYPDTTRLLNAFDAMQNLQIERSMKAGVPRYRQW